MSNVIDITGQTFGYLTVLKRVQNTKRGAARFEYECICGKRKIGSGTDIRRGRITSCGCMTENTRRKDYTGQKFGKLTAIKFEYSKKGKSYWRFKCDCGNEVVYEMSPVKIGKTIQCRECHKKWEKDKNRKFLQIGEIYGFLQVLALVEEEGGTAYECKCLKCGNHKVIKAYLLRKGYRKTCGCVKSWVEEKIALFLEQQKISFQREKTFPDLFYKNQSRPLRFDFAIYSNSNKLIGLIEYNGIQHYTEKDFGKEQRITDKIKEEYCKKENIPLLILNKETQYEEEILNFIKTYEVE